MLDELLLERFKSIHEEQDKPPNILAVKPMWSLKHIFGMEPICLKQLGTPNVGMYYGITVHTLNLGTTKEMNEIEIDLDELNEMNKLPLDDSRFTDPANPKRTLKRIPPKRAIPKAEPQPESEPQATPKQTESGLFLPEVPIVP